MLLFLIQRGIADILSQQDDANLLILSLDSPSVVSRTATIDFLLAIVTLDYPKGHKNVMDALSFFQKKRELPRIFDCLIMALSSFVNSRGVFGTVVGSQPTPNNPFSFAFEKSKPPSEKDIRDHLVALTALVRFLVEVPGEFEYRMYIRNEMMSSGLANVFRKIQSWARHEFRDVIQHIEAFENLRVSDFQYLLENMDSEMTFDTQDPVQLLGALKQKLSQNENRTLTSLVQNIVVGTALLDKDSRTYMLHIIEKAVMYIVLDQNGISNFTDAFKYSVDQIISGLAELDQLERVCAFQETEIISLRERRDQESIQDLDEHLKKLQIIYTALRSQNQFERVESVITVVGDSPANTLPLRIEREVLQPEATAPAVPGIPPPPPPPLFGGVFAGVPPPPPPPLASNTLGFTQEPVALHKYKPKTNMRRIHWEFVPKSTIKDSVWSKIDTETLEDEMNNLGFFAELEENFKLSKSRNLASNASKNCSTTNNVLTEKRAQNIMIFLGTLRSINVSQLIESIQKFDTKVSESVLTQILEAYPNEQEKKQLQAIKGFQEIPIRAAEAFMLQISNINRLQSRIQVMLIHSSFYDNYSRVKNVTLFLMQNIICSIDAYRSILKSTHLPQLLRMILAVGNYINAASAAKISGFKITFLEKILDIKANSSPVIDTVAKLIKQSDPTVFECITEMEPITKISLANLSVGNIDSDMAELQKNFKLVSMEKHASQEYQSSPLYHKNDEIFKSELNQFHDKLTQKISILVHERNVLQNEVGKVYAFFGETKESKLQPEDFLMILDKFVNALEKSQKEINRVLPQPKPKVKGTSKDVGNLDNLLENLKSKPAFMSLEQDKKVKRRDIDIRRKPIMERNAAIFEQSEDEPAKSLKAHVIKQTAEMQQIGLKSPKPYAGSKSQESQHTLSLEGNSGDSEAMLFQLRQETLQLFSCLD